MKNGTTFWTRVAERHPHLNYSALARGLGMSRQTLESMRRRGTEPRLDLAQRVARELRDQGLLEG